MNKPAADGAETSEKSKSQLDDAQQQAKHLNDYLAIRQKHLVAEEVELEFRQRHVDAVRGVLADLKKRTDEAETALSQLKSQHCVELIQFQKKSEDFLNKLIACKNANLSQLESDSKATAVDENIDPAVGPKALSTAALSNKRRENGALNSDGNVTNMKEALKEKRRLYAQRKQTLHQIQQENDRLSVEAENAFANLKTQLQNLRAANEQAHCMAVEEELHRLQAVADEFARANVEKGNATDSWV